MATASEYNDGGARQALVDALRECFGWDDLDDPALEIDEDFQNPLARKAWAGEDKSRQRVYFDPTNFAEEAHAFATSVNNKPMVVRVVWRDTATGRTSFCTHRRVFPSMEAAYDAVNDLHAAVAAYRKIRRAAEQLDEDQELYTYLDNLA